VSVHDSSGGPPIKTLTRDLSGWSTEELLEEVLKRSAADGPALRLLEAAIIRARLAESDRQFLDFGRQQALGQAGEWTGVGGTMEMSLAGCEE
jgi:hypothetical protein